MRLLSLFVASIAATLTTRAPAALPQTAVPTRAAYDVDDDNGIEYYFPFHQAYECGIRGCSLKLNITAFRPLCIMEIFISLDDNQEGNKEFDVFISGPEEFVAQPDASDGLDYYYGATYSGTARDTHFHNTVFQGQYVCFDIGQHTIILTGDIRPRINYVDTDIYNYLPDASLIFDSAHFKRTYIDETGVYEQVQVEFLMSFMYKDKTIARRTNLLSSTPTSSMPTSMPSTSPTSLMYIDDDEEKSNHKVLCGRRVEVVCNQGQHINTLVAALGRDSKYVCNVNNSYKCPFVDVSNFLRIRCVGRKHCSIAVKKLIKEVGDEGLKLCSPYVTIHHTCEEDDEVDNDEDDDDE